jgi:hypothetical protein
MSNRHVVSKMVEAIREILPLTRDMEKDSDGEEIADLKGQLSRLERKYWEQFDVIEKVIKERDQWKDLYKKHVMEHLSAQNILSRSIIMLRTQMSKLLQILNRLLEEKGEKPIKAPKDLESIEGYPVDLPEKFVEKMKDLHLAMKADFDAISRRDEIGSGMKRPSNL